MVDFFRSAMVKTFPDERKWQERWREAGLGFARRFPGRQKFYIVFAYPGSSGFMHLGHMRGYTYADAIARYHRMKGEAVFFPGGTHASGLPAVTFAAKVEKKEHYTIEGLRQLGLDPVRIAELKEPAAAARFLGKTYWDIWERFGLIMDRSAYLTTIDPDYQQFIRWQFLKLEEKGYLVRKPYFSPFCPRSGPVSVDPSETDLAKGGEAEVVTYTALPFRLPDGRALLAATLRPETLYGATNLWLPMEAPLVEWRIMGRTYLATEQGVSRLLEQVGGEKGATVPLSELLVLKAKAPLTGEELPLIPSALVDPAQGSGVVMSVPGHAPADWVALQQLSPALSNSLKKAIRVIVEIPDGTLASSEKTLLLGDGPPAARAVANVGVKGLSDTLRLAEATERVYRLEFSHGVLSAGPYAGEPVPRARDRVFKEVIAKEGAVEIRAFSEPVICRCGEKVVIRRIPDQWFLAYGSEKWKEETRRHIETMTIQPAEYGRELVGILDWFDDRPAVRQGRWLGTPFPLDPRWIIEPIADSTLYPAYYIVRRFVTAGKLYPEHLTPAFFDYVYLGQGEGEPSVAKALQEEIREEFLYWYPLDINVGGKEHKRVHFPPFLYNHVALLPPPSRPRGIFVYWWLTSYTGEKLSKKDLKGGAIPTVDGALNKFGADGLRLYYALSASSSQDVEWDEDLCEAAHQRVEEVLRMIASFRTASESAGGSVHMDQWLATNLRGTLERVRKALESWDLREAAQEIYVAIPSYVHHYRARGGADSKLLALVGDLWARMLVPVTPHAAEESYAQLHPGKGLAAEARFPMGEELSPLSISEETSCLERERVVEMVKDDLAALLKIWTNGKTKIRLFVAATWKYAAEAKVRDYERREGELNISSFLTSITDDPELLSHRGELAQYLKDRKRGVSPKDLPSLLSQKDELEVLKEAVPYLSRVFQDRLIEVEREEDGATNDAEKRRSRAKPGKPAISLLNLIPFSPRSGENRKES